MSKEETAVKSISVARVCERLTIVGSGAEGLLMKELSIKAEGMKYRHFW